MILDGVGPVQRGGDTVAGEPACFAEALRILISEAGYTQEDLATKAGLGLSTISELTRGKHPRCQKGTAGRLADALALDGRPGGIFIAVARGLLPATRLAEYGLWEQLVHQARRRG
jgi:transcriptional regulator with XRE-family HTH domain